MGSRIRRSIRETRPGEAPRGEAGFTLIELIVVIALISILLFFSMPRFQGEILEDDTQKALRWVMHTAKNLRQDAVKHQKIHILHVEPDEGAMWVSDAGMTEEEAEAARKEKYEFPNHMTIVAVEFPGSDRTGQEEAEIRFHPKGYSDRAAIHFRTDGEEQISLVIEPFLANIKVYDTHVGFEK